MYKMQKYLDSGIKNEKIIKNVPCRSAHLLWVNILLAYSNIYNILWPSRKRDYN